MKKIYFLALMIVMHVVPAVFSKPVVQKPNAPSSQGVSSTVSAGAWGQFKAKAQVLGEKIANSFKLNSTGAIGKHFTSTGSVGKHFTQTSPMGEYFSQKVNKLATKVEKITSKMPTVFTKKKPASKPAESRKDSIDTLGDLGNSYGAEPIYAVPQVPSSPKPQDTAPQHQSRLDQKSPEYENLHTKEWINGENSVKTGGNNNSTGIYQNIENMDVPSGAAQTVSVISSLNMPPDLSSRVFKGYEDRIYVNLQKPENPVLQRSTEPLYQNLQQARRGLPQLTTRKNVRFKEGLNIKEFDIEAPTKTVTDIPLQKKIVNFDSKSSPEKITKQLDLDSISQEKKENLILLQDRSKRVSNVTESQLIKVDEEGVKIDSPDAGDEPVKVNPFQNVDRKLHTLNTLNKKYNATSVVEEVLDHIVTEKNLKKEYAKSPGSKDVAAEIKALEFAIDNSRQKQKQWLASRSEAIKKIAPKPSLEKVQMALNKQKL